MAFLRVWFVLMLLSGVIYTNIMVYVSNMWSENCNIIDYCDLISHLMSLF